MRLLRRMHKCATRANAEMTSKQASRDMFNSNSNSGSNSQPPRLKRRTRHSRSYERREYVHRLPSMLAGTQPSCSNSNGAGSSGHDQPPPPPPPPEVSKEQQDLLSNQLTLEGHNRPDLKRPTWWTARQETSRRTEESGTQMPHTNWPQRQPEAPGTAKGTPKVINRMSRGEAGS